MTRIATHLTAAIAAVLLVGLSAGCSSDSSDTASPTSTVTVTSPTATSAPSDGTGSADAGATDATSAAPQETTRQQRPPAITVVPASTYAVGSYYAFASPSGKIQCRSIEGNFICRTQDLPHTVPTSSLCNFYGGEEQGRAVQFGWFTSRPDVCATIIQGEGWSAQRILGYGERVTLPPAGGRTVTCSSATDGLTCTQVGGSGARGFFLSAASFTVL
ncbi:hypothetical protein [Williamsia sp. M5A3_1d]